MASRQTHDDIEAQIRELQNKKKGLNEVAEKEKERVSLGNTGFFDQEIYGGSGKFEGYVTSIAPNEVDDADDEEPTYGQNKRSFNAPAALLNDIPQAEQDYDPFADRRRPTIADREDEYRARRRQMVISPERLDPFADVSERSGGGPAGGRGGAGGGRNFT